MQCDDAHDAMLMQQTWLRKGMAYLGCYRRGRGNPDVPPPPNPDMTQVLRLLMADRQASRDIQQASIMALQQIAANINPQPNAGGGNRSSLRHFQDTDPPRFAKPIQPLDADDWLRTIQNNLEVAEVLAPRSEERRVGKEC